MRKGYVAAVFFGMVLSSASALFAQFTADEVSQRPQWEEFLKTADIVGERQISGREAVTSPWVLTLKKGDITHQALWKNAQGRMGGFIEGWQYEIAAYLLDKLIGLNMVPPTVMREFHENKGSCQSWVDGTMTLLQRQEKKIKMPPIKVFGWNRATYLQRFWDNLIDNEDRHLNQILITADWRMVLIDHSRSFRNAKTSKKLIYTEKHPEGPKLMSELPRRIVDNAKALTFESIRAAVGDTLTDEEIRLVLFRRDLILAEIDRLIQKNGEANVLY